MADIMPERAQGTNSDWQRLLYEKRKSEVRAKGIDHDFPFDMDAVLSLTVAHREDWRYWANFVQFRGVVVQLDDEEFNHLLHVLCIDESETQRVVARMKHDYAMVYLAHFHSFDETQAFLKAHGLDGLSRFRSPISAWEIWAALEK